MKKQSFSFDLIEREVMKKTFGVLNTINDDGSPHTTGVLYGVSPQSSKFALYIVTSKKYKKIKNIQNNPQVSFTIIFPHHWLRFVPANTVTFNGIAEVIDFYSEGVLDIFLQKRILRMITKNLSPKEKEEYVFIKIKPLPKVLCYGLGYNIFKLRSSHAEGGYSVTIPQERLFDL